ncbi:fused isobutyryl-CoA mutase [Rubritalea halochordaticola]|uniref:Fused isobutyryl-CoA mutase n=1 Tax=Rubritalea halochordaticola TaxID=714537 RepID=A0ABP9V6H7_9BACT
MKKSLRPIRLLTAVPLCDGHDSAVTTVNEALIRQGFEVVYMGYHRAVEDMVRAAIQEDVAGLGISSYNGGHVEFFRDVVNQLRMVERCDLGVFGGGGGTITRDDVKLMKVDGVDEIFLAGTSFAEITQRLEELYGERELKMMPVSTDLGLGKTLTAVEYGLKGRAEPGLRGKARVIGFTGPGGVGKTTLIDEWIRGALLENENLRIGVLSHDPSSVRKGGLLGDRATMVYSQDDRVFIRSMATRGKQGGLSEASEECLRWMVSEEAGFDYVLVETVGTGQEALPFEDSLVDTKVLVLHPEYGAALQLQKILMLEVADAVVVNKCDWRGAARALDEVGRKLSQRGVPLYATQASEHADEGVAKFRKEISHG